MASQHRVVLVGPLPPPVGGVSSHVAGLASFLASRDIRCTVVDAYPEEREKLAIPGVSHLVFKGPWRFLKIMWHLLREEWRRPGIIHLHFSHGAGRLLAFCAILFFPGKKVYLTLHNGDQAKYFGKSGRASRLLAGKIIRRVDKVFALSVEQETFYRSIGVLPGRIGQWPPVVTWLSKGDDSLLPRELRALSPVESGGSESILLTSGYPHRDYQFEQSLRLLDEMPEGIPARLVVSLYGQAQDPAYEVELRRKLKAHPKVIVVETLSHEAFIALLSKASLYLRPSSVDSFGLAIAESLNQGVPCLASDVCNRDPRCTTFAAGDFGMFKEKALAIIGRGRASRKRPGIAPMDFSDHDKIADFYRDQSGPANRPA